jgi:hypothetical protein
MAFTCSSSSGFDLSGFDVRRLAALRDVPVRIKEKLDEVDREDAVRVAREFGYTAVGFGVLAFQRAQVRRRELIDALQGDLPSYLARVTDQATATIEEVRTLVDVIRTPGRST